MSRGRPRAERPLNRLDRNRKDAPEPFNGAMRASVFFVATVLFANGCLEESSCVLAPSWSFHVETCSTIPEEVSLSVDGACADATFRCVTPEPCTRWGVWAFQAGLCTVHLGYLNRKVMGES